jgi:trimeric autotransporter adhesin
MVDNAARDADWSTTGNFPTLTALASTGNTERLIGVAFTPGSDLVVIPVELMSFKGSLINDKANLQWETATEINAKAFIVEKSTDAKTFEAIGTVAAKGGSSRTSYDFDDEKLNQNVNYYRLKMTDNDGSFKYSNVVAIKLGGKTKGSVSVFPNPVTNNITINHDAAEEGTIIRIVNITGITVAQFNVAKDATQTSVDASQLAAGQYFVNFIAKGRGLAKTTSFVK